MFRSLLGHFLKSYVRSIYILYAGRWCDRFEMYNLGNEEVWGLLFNMNQYEIFAV